MAQVGVSSGYTFISAAQIVAFEQRCLQQAEELMKQKYLTVIAERDSIIANCSNLIETLRNEKSILVS